MSPDCVEKHRLAGLDERARGFNRLVEIRRGGQGYCAFLWYEARQVSTDWCDSRQAALEMLVRRLHAEGFTQLRTQLSFRGSEYLGSREPWIEHPDPEKTRSKSRLARWFDRWMGRWVGRRIGQTDRSGLPCI